MRKSYQSAISALEVIEEHFRCTEWIVKEGVIATPTNKAFIVDLMTITAAIWIDVSHTPSLINRRWANYLCSRPVVDVVAFFKDVDNQLIKESQHSYASFKGWLKLNYGEFGAQMMAPLRENLIEFFDRCTGLGGLRSCIRFMTRANFPDPIGLEEEAAAKWINRATIPWSPLDVSPERDEVTRIFPRCLLSRFDEAPFIGRFGPGYEAFRSDKSILSKYRHFYFDRKLAYFAQKVGHSVDELPRGRLSETEALRVSDVGFAPKWLDVLRVVSKEPAGLMYYQLGGFRWIMQIIKRSAWGSHIDLENADLNKELAYDGSLSGEFATIDLSNASDCVRNALVEQLTATSCLRELSRCTRTKYAAYKGQLYEPSYFAPMGSGMCFPMECIVFASVVAAVMRRHRDQRAWRVYGDDIIVPSERYDEVTQRLISLGFEVNLEKSFTGTSCFRESCGGDYFSGIDVRPVYISRFWKGLPTPADVRSSSKLTRNISLANRLRDFPSARSLVVRRLLDIYPGLLFSASEETGVFSTQPTNFHLRSRFNKISGSGRLAGGLWLREVRHQYVATPQADPLEDEYEDIRLYEWLRQRAEIPTGESESELSISRARRPVVKWAWSNPYHWGLT